MHADGESTMADEDLAAESRRSIRRLSKAMQLQLLPRLFQR